MEVHLLLMLDRCNWFLLFGSRIKLSTARGIGNLPRSGRGPSLYWVHFSDFNKTSKCYLTRFRFGSVVVDDPAAMSSESQFLSHCCHSQSYSEIIFDATKQAGVRALVSAGWVIGELDLLSRAVC